MQEVIEKLLNLGAIPAYKDATSEMLYLYADLLDSIETPVTEEEAKVLVTLFSPDDAGEINWTIIHIVETAPNWPPQTYLEAQPDSLGIKIVIDRCKNAGLWK